MGKTTLGDRNRPGQVSPLQVTQSPGTEGDGPSLKELLNYLGISLGAQRRGQRRAAPLQTPLFSPQFDPEDLVSAFFQAYEEDPKPIASDALPLMAYLLVTTPPRFLGRKGPIRERESVSLALATWQAMTGVLCPASLAGGDEEKTLLLADYFSRLCATAEVALRAYRSLLKRDERRGNRGAPSPSLEPRSGRGGVPKDDWRPR